MTRACRAPISTEHAVAWLLGELSAREAAGIEDHLFACGPCTRELEILQRLGRDVARTVRAGLVSVAVSSALLERAASDGMRLRAYRIRDGEAVRCTAGPRDDGVVVRLEVDAGKGETVDLAAEVSLLDSGERFSQVTEDVVVDRTRGEVAYLFPGAFVRDLPRSRWDLTTRVHGEAGTRIGSYAMMHTPWEQLPAEERGDG